MAKNLSAPTHECIRTKIRTRTNTQFMGVYVIKCNNHFDTRIDSVTFSNKQYLQSIPNLIWTEILLLMQKYIKSKYIVLFLAPCSFYLCKQKIIMRKHEDIFPLTWVKTKSERETLCRPTNAVETEMQKIFRLGLEE